MTTIEVGYFASLLVVRVIRVLRVVLKIIKLIKNAIHLTLSLITFVLLVFGRIPVNSSHFSLYFVSILSPKYYILKVLMCSFNKRNCIVDKSLKIINSFSSGDKFHIFHSIPSDINISTSIYPPLKRKPPLKSS